MANPSSDYGESVANNAVNTGQNALNAFDPTALGGKIASGFGSLFGSQQNQQNDYLSAYKQQIANQTPYQQLYTQAGEKYNLPQLTQQSTYLNNQVSNQPFMQQQLARGFNYDQNQVDNATQQALYRLQPLANKATAETQAAAGLTGQEVGYAQAQQAKELQPTQTQGQMLTDIWARQASGYTTAAQAELEGLINKMNAGVTLSTAEMGRANALAQAEASYQGSLLSAQAQQNVANIANIYKILPAGQTLANTVTGSLYRAS